MEAVIDGIEDHMEQFKERQLSQQKELIGQQGHITARQKAFAEQHNQLEGGTRAVTTCETINATVQRIKSRQAASCQQVEQYNLPFWR